MCLICKDYQLGKMTSIEAMQNLGEMLEEIGEKHGEEIIMMMIEKESESIDDFVSGLFDQPENTEEKFEEEELDDDDLYLSFYPDYSI